jgi:hypothetical protein
LGYAGKELDAFPNLIDAGIYLCDGFIQPLMAVFHMEGYLFAMAARIIPKSNWPVQL